MAERRRNYLSRSWQGKSHEEWTKPGETEKEADSKGDIVLCTSICNQIVATGYGQLVRRNISRYHWGIRERRMNERQVVQKEVVEETALNRRYFEMYYFYSLFVSSVLRIMCICICNAPLASTSRVVIAGYKGAGEFTADRSVNRRRPSRQSARKFHRRWKNRDNYGSVVVAASVTIYVFFSCKFALFRINNFRWKITLTYWKKNKGVTRN